MNREETIKAVVEKVEENEGLWMIDDAFIKEALKKASIRSELARSYGIIVTHDKDRNPEIAKKRVVEGGVSEKKKTSKKKEVKVEELGSVEHEYYFPKFTDEIKALFKCTEDWQKYKAVNIRVYGPTGSGKSVFFRLIAEEMFGAYYQVNGHSELDTAVLLGERTIKIDEKTQQSYISHKKGLLEVAMTHGLKKDDNGEVELDENGKVIVVGKPALLFIDEYAAIPSNIMIALNRVLEIPDKPGESRSLELSTDGGRKVLSHPGFCIALSGNTKGLGLNEESEQMYTAQAEQQDISVLKRITATYAFGYNLQAEKRIMMKKLRNDIEVMNLLKFREAIRKAYKERRVETLFSTRDIVVICDLAKQFKDANIDKPIVRAIYRSVFSGLLETEVPVWKEVIYSVYAVDVLREYEEGDEIWMP